jgi:hypothetical protein
MARIVDASAILGENAVSAHCADRRCHQTGWYSGRCTLAGLDPWVSASPITCLAADRVEISGTLAGHHRSDVHDSVEGNGRSPWDSRARIAKRETLGDVVERLSIHNGLLARGGNAAAGEKGRNHEGTNRKGCRADGASQSPHRITPYA